MSDELNTISVVGDTLLLVLTRGGAKVHVVAEAQRGDDPDASGRWSTQTLCGRNWSVVAPTTDSRWHGEAVYAPSCRSCLSSLDRRFPSPAEADGVDTVAVMTVASLEAHGSAEIYNCPADQVEHLRKRVRRVAKSRRLGPIQSTVADHVVVFWDDTPVRQEDVDRLTKALDGLTARGGTSEEPFDHRIEWGLWAR